MLNYSSIIQSAPVMVMFDSKKGDLSNRMSCAGEQFKNNVIVSAKSGALGIGASGLYYYARKNPASITKAGNLLNKALYKFAEKIPALKNSKVMTKVLKTSGKAKLACLAGAVILGVFDNIVSKHIFRAGQIDQKYTDMAKVKEHQNNILA